MKSKRKTLATTTRSPPPKKKGDGTATKKKEAKEKFVYGQKYIGKITQLDANSATKDFTLLVTWKVAEPNPQAQQQLVQQQMRLLQQQQQLANHQFAFARANNFQAKQSAAQQIAQSQNQIAQTYVQMQQTQQNLTRLKTVSKDLKLRVSEKCIFRILTPEPEYDEKGNPIEFKKADLERLKGKHKDYPGYQAEADALVPI